MAGRRPGPVPKGQRKQRTLRLPLEHDEVYAAAAGAAGLDFSDYIALVLAQHHELPTPTYIHRRARGGGQRELPIGA